MRLFRGLLGALLWILASVLGLVGLLLCITVIVLLVGIPVLDVGRRLSLLPTGPCFPARWPIR
jgi:hypothetical protein